MNTIPPIRDEADLDASLARAEKLLEAGEPSDELDVLLVLIEDYEGRHHQLPPGDPVEVIRFKLRELDLSRDELAHLAEMDSGRLSEVLNRKRELTLSMVPRLSQALGIAPGLLTGRLKTSRPPGSHTGGTVC